MSNTQNPDTHVTDLSLTQKLIIIFGTNTTIKANYAPDGTVTFRDPNNTHNTLETPLPEGVEFFGPGQYTIDIGTDSFDFTLAEE
jgi:hypothetical protein